MLTLNKLTVGYRGHSVLEPISLSLEEGESLLIVGSNGAGKSTLIRTIFGLLPPVAGSVNVMGIEVRLGILSTLVQKGVRFLGQGNRAFGDMTTEEQSGVMFRLYGSERSTDAPLPSSQTRGRVGTLSIGQRRIEALRLLDSKDSRMFALDEPRMGLDMYSSRHVRKWLEQKIKRRVPMIMVEHEFRDIIHLFDKVIVVWSGKVRYMARPTEESAIGDVIRQMMHD